MIKHVILSCSIIAFIVGYIYSKSDGLIISIDDSGIIDYSNTLLSSGSDDGFILALGFMTFISSAIFSIVNYIINYFKSISDKPLKIVYTINYVFFLFVVYLVNLDVSVFNSIKLGDTKLLFGLLITTLPFFFFFSKKVTYTRPSQRTGP